MDLDNIHSFSAAALRNPLFDRVPDNHFIQQRRFVRPLAQDAAQTLRILLCAGRAAQNDSHFCFRHIDTFIQGTAGEQRLELSVSEAVQDGLSLGSFAMVGNRRK